jgi:hypothetical protein
MDEDQQTTEQEMCGALQTVFVDGVQENVQTYSQIINKLKGIK